MKKQMQEFEHGIKNSTALLRPFVPCNANIMDRETNTRRTAVYWLFSLFKSFLFTISSFLHLNSTTGSSWYSSVRHIMNYCLLVQRFFCFSSEPPKEVRQSTCDIFNATSRSVFISKQVIELTVSRLTSNQFPGICNRKSEINTTRLTETQILHRNPG